MSGNNGNGNGNSISRRAVLVTLNCGCWAARKRDKETGAEVCQTKKAEKDAAIVTKRLLRQEYLSPITTQQTRARNLVYKYCLPWLGQGVHLLPAEFLLVFQQEMVALKKAHDEAVAEFIERYGAIVAQERREAQERLGDLFDPSDFPAPSVLQGKFNLDWNICPVPESGDFRIDVAQQDIAELRADYEAKDKKREAEVAGRVASRVADALASFAAKIQPGKVFRDSVTDELADLAKLLDGLNVTQDERISEIAKSVRSLGKVKPEDLRDDERERAKTLRKADDLRKQAASIAGIF